MDGECTLRMGGSLRPLAWDFYSERIMVAVTSDDWWRRSVPLEGSGSRRGVLQVVLIRGGKWPVIRPSFGSLVPGSDGGHPNVTLFHGLFHAIPRLRIPLKTPKKKEEIEERNIDGFRFF